MNVTARAPSLRAGAISGGGGIGMGPITPTVAAFPVDIEHSLNHLTNYSAREVISASHEASYNDFCYLMPEEGSYREDAAQVGVSKRQLYPY